jgi:glycosyltransferase involved in cell wall biosynthesis
VRLLVLNIRLDAGDTALGFTTAWVNALADRVESVDVVTMRTGRIAVRDNVAVHSLEFDRHGAAGRAAAFYRTVVPLARRRRFDACFAHMTPLPAILFAPVGKALGVPTLLWYAHKSVPRQVRAAERVVARVVSSTPEGFRLPRQGKVRHVGQGIDTARFTPPEQPGPEYERTAVSVGRIAPIKHVEGVIAAAGEAGLALELAGGPLTPADREYEVRLRASSPEWVRWAGPVPFDRVPEAYRRGRFFLSLSESGSIDKALLEAMASGCLPLSRNDAFRSVVGGEFPELVPDPGRMGERLAELAALPVAERAALSARLRALVERDHSLDRLADRLVAELEELAR